MSNLRIDLTKSRPYTMSTFLFYRMTLAEAEACFAAARVVPMTDQEKEVALIQLLTLQRNFAQHAGMSWHSIWSKEQYSVLSNNEAKLDLIGDEILRLALGVEAPKAVKK